MQMPNTYLVLMGSYKQLHLLYGCRKVLNMRLFPNLDTGKGWDLSVKQCNFGVLLVSQFTLYGILKGNKPDFHVAMPPHKAKPFYESLVEKFRKAYTSDAVKDGVFGAMMKVSSGKGIVILHVLVSHYCCLFLELMQVNLVNDGPVTMQLDSSQSRVGASLEDVEQDLPL
ncbi:D-aminoacyl-tRNA deacylase isoform X2 [Zingiber officinale]|uniref:D-aminoacyl-tRNA deacylase isoform X2 n=1 Tax=Zingiber officinale TaxID=94328 RepID=UPI001C4B6833|nr:D-aminoacyl-tRNA deacylase isoform X2 [Zingiber officinale]